MAMHRRHEVESVAEDRRHVWLAGQIDEVDAKIITELEAMRKTLNRILVAVAGLLVTVLASTVTALISSAYK